MLTKPLKYHAEANIRSSKAVLAKFAEDVKSQPAQALTASGNAFQAAACLQVATQLLAQLNAGAKVEVVLAELDTQLRASVAQMPGEGSPTSDLFNRHKAVALAQMSKDAHEMLAYN